MTFQTNLQNQIEFLIHDSISELIFSFSVVFMSYIYKLKYGQLAITREIALFFFMHLHLHIQLGLSDEK